MGKVLGLRHEDQSLDPRTHIKKLGVAICAYNLSSGEAEAEGFLELAGQPM